MMRQESARFGKRWLGLLVTVGLTIVLLVWTWLSVQAGNVPVEVGLPSPTGKLDTALSLTLTYSESTTATVYMPMVMRDHRPPPSVFGVQMTTIDNAGGLAQAVEADVHWVRFHGFRWDEIEPVRANPPRYDWTHVDEQSLRNAPANGMDVVGIVHATPPWAQKYPGSSCGPIEADALDEFAQFLTALVNRYGAPPYNVRHWELGNEPDAPINFEQSVYGCWGDGNEDDFGGRYYARMLQVAYPAIKAVDPQAQVFIGGLLLDCDPANAPVGKDCRPGNFLEGILAGGGGPYFDVVSYHAYTYYAGALGQMTNPNWPGSVTAVPEKTAFLRGVLERYGYGDKAIMNTEAAMLCSNPTDECLETQAIYVPRAYAEALALGLKGHVYYAMINEPWRYTGLLLPDLTPKKVYYAYHTAATFLTRVTYQGPVGGYPAGIEGYAFRQKDTLRRVDVVWSANGSAQSLTLPAGTSAYDRYGSLVASSGVIQVDYGPVYVVTP
ncbi:hypothetical protein ACFLYD_06945 [Chloroflexota bacterium]